MDRPRSSRRDFLKGKAAVDALQSLTAGIELPAAGLAGAIELPEADYLVHVGREAMACQFEVLLNAGQYPHGTAAAVAALDLIDELESQLTVYRDTSEVSRLNRRAAAEPVAVEARLYALLKQAIILHQETLGAYDITSGPLSKVWGFYRRQGALPGEQALADALAKVGSRWIELDDAAQTVRFTREGVELNLGSIGKGYALDRAAEYLAGQGVAHYLIQGGQSSVLARGERLGTASGWRVAVKDPLRPERRMAEIRLNDQALSTSGSAVQFFWHGGRRYSHILDPRTGQPAEGVLSVTVVAPTAAEADAISTAFFVMGVDAAREYCAAHPELAVAMVVPGRGGRSVQLLHWGFADDALSVIATSY